MDLPGFVGLRVFVFRRITAEVEVVGGGMRV